MPPTTIYNQRVTERGNKGKKTLTTYVNPEILKELKIQSATEARSMTLIVEELIKDYLKKKKR